MPGNRLEMTHNPIGRASGEDQACIVPIA